MQPWDFQTSLWQFHQETLGKYTPKPPFQSAVDWTATPILQFAFLNSLVLLTPLWIHQDMLCLPCPVPNPQIPPVDPSISPIFACTIICLHSKPASLAGSLTFPLLGWISATSVIMP